jgi:hypothetical protein
MAVSSRIFYPVESIAVSYSATGFNWNTGFNNVYTGANSGTNLIQTFQRVQSFTDNFAITRQDINQLGVLAAISREITSPPTVNASMSYYVADLSNERLLGLYVSGGIGAVTPILDQSQASKNLYLSISPPGSNNIGYTGQKQVVQITNAYLASWATEGSVGNIPTTNVSWQAFNWATSTGSINQPSLAINPTSGNYVTGINFTLPTATSGIDATVAALRPGDISVNLSNAGIGLNLSDLKAQSYSINFDLNLQPLNKLGSFFPYAIEASYPVTLSASFSCYYGDLVTGSLRDIICDDDAYQLEVILNDPCGGGEAVRYTMKGMKLDGQDFSQQDVGSIASQVNLSFSSQIGTSDSPNGLFLSGRNI